jgi:hypothetical protein
VSEYSSPKHRNSKNEQPLAGCAVTIFAFLCIHTMAYLHHTKENLETLQTVTLTEICTQFLISSNTTLFATHLISDSETGLQCNKTITSLFPPIWINTTTFFFLIFSTIHEVTAPNSVLRLKALSTHSQLYIN